jgi:GGDEF domain-containing protein
MCHLTFYYGVNLGGAEIASAVDPVTVDPVTVDPVTGLAVRSALLADLGVAVAPGSRTSLLAVFVLDGLKEFEELKGVIEGRKLLGRLGERLSAVVHGVGTGYHPRNDEFAILVTGRVSASAILTDAIAALSESDRYYSVVATAGHVVLPDEASDPIEALIVADKRLTTASPRRAPRR